MASKFIEFLKENNALLKFVNNIKTLSPLIYQRVENDDPEKVVEAYQEFVDNSPMKPLLCSISNPRPYIDTAFDWIKSGEPLYWSKLNRDWKDYQKGPENTNKITAIKQWFKDQGLDEILRQEQEQSMKNFYGEKLMKEKGLSVEGMDEFSLKKHPDSYPLTTFVLSKSIKGPEFWKEKLQEFEDWKTINFGK